MGAEVTTQSPVHGHHQANVQSTCFLKKGTLGGRQLSESVMEKTRITDSRLCSMRSTTQLRIFNFHIHLPSCLVVYICCICIQTKWENIHAKINVSNDSNTVSDSE